MIPVRERFRMDLDDGSQTELPSGMSYPLGWIDDWNGFYVFIHKIRQALD